MSSTERSAVGSRQSAVERSATADRSEANRRPPTTIVIALGSNLGDRRYHLQRALHALGEVMRIVRVSAMRETEAVDAPPGSPPFLNMVVTGYTTLAPALLLETLLAIEQRLGRVRRGMRNEPRVIDLDLILYGAVRMRTKTLTLPHPRAHERSFVMEPLRECGVPPNAFR